MSESPNLKKRIDPRLNVMMFMEYGVKGLWMPLAGIILVAPVAAGGLGFTESQKGMIIGIPLAIGSFLAPFIAGQLTDRMFPTQKCLAVMLLGAGILKFTTALACGWDYRCFSQSFTYRRWRLLIPWQWRTLAIPRSSFPEYAYGEPLPGSWSPGPFP